MNMPWVFHDPTAYFTVLVTQLPGKDSDLEQTDVIG